MKKNKTVGISETATIEKPKAQIIIRSPVICARCKAKDSMRATTGPRMVGMQKVSYMRCRECGHQAQIRYL